MVIYGEVVSYPDAVCNENKRVIQQLADEEQGMGGYDRKYEELYLFRKVLKDHYVEGDIEADTLTPQITVLENGHILDHHVLGYLAPMEFKRVGFGDVYRTPVEQIIMLDKQLRQMGIRFVYAPIPCKLAVYPEIAGIDDYVPEDGMVIPQWRKMLYQLSLTGVEIVDCYDPLRNLKEEKPLFSRNHHISPYGADVIGREIAEYIKKTTELNKSHKYFEFTGVMQEVEDEVLWISGDYSSRKMGMESFEAACTQVNRNGKDEIYTGEEVESEICIIGDCNLQSYRYKGCDITAVLSRRLGYPVQYGGRYLPFAKIDRIDRMPDNLLEKTRLLVYTGFVSGGFVRAYRKADVWSRNLIPDSVFGKRLEGAAVPVRRER